MSIKSYFKKEVKTVFIVKYKKKLCHLNCITETSAVMHYIIKQLFKVRAAIATFKLKRAKFQSI